MANELPKKYLVDFQDITMGTDPELFFSTKAGKIIGSERIIPEDGIVIPRNGESIVRDGIQVEFHTPGGLNCRQSVALRIEEAFREFDRILSTQKDVVLNYATTVKVDEEEILSLSEKSRVLGCKPSFNIYEKDAVIDVDPESYRYRSAGGHIHLGSHYSSPLGTTSALKNVEVLVPILDAVVGNTAVLLDRDGGNKIRRRVYGRAGEYRLPEYGLEYRTLSNFWLKSYPVMSLMFSLSRLAVHIVSQDTKDNKFVSRIMERIDQDAVREAINNNNMILARQNFYSIAPAIQGMLDPAHNHSLPFEDENTAPFMYFVRKKLNHWFPQTPMEYWLNHHKTLGIGWENFFNLNLKTGKAVSK